MHLFTQLKKGFCEIQCNYFLPIPSFAAKWTNTHKNTVCVCTCIIFSGRSVKSYSMHYFGGYVYMHNILKPTTPHIILRNFYW